MRLGMIAATVVASLNCQAAPEHSHALTLTSPERAIEQCVHTGGNWHRALHACTCPAGKIFEQMTGCHHTLSSFNETCSRWTEMNSAQIDRCLSQTFGGRQVLVRTAGLGADELASLANALEQDASVLLRGFDLSAVDEASAPQLRFSPMTQPSEFRYWIPYASDAHPATSILPFALDWGQAMPTTHAACAEALRGIDQTAVDELCGALGDAHNAVLNDQIEAQFVEEGRNCTQLCAWKAHVTTAKREVLYLTLMRAHVPWVRLLVASDQFESRLLLFLAPTGRVMGSIYLRNALNDVKAPRMLQTEQLLFDSRWHLLASETRDSGIRDRLDAILSN